jgi:hypothetical protein
MKCQIPIESFEDYGASMSRKAHIEELNSRRFGSDMSLTICGQFLHTARIMNSHPAKGIREQDWCKHCLRKKEKSKK